MLYTSVPTPGLLFASFLYRKDLLSPETLFQVWEKSFGKSFMQEPLHNPLANYYSQEMGQEKDLARFFLLTSTTFPREALLSTKLLALEWEENWAVANKRMVNVDIGFLSLENFTLATTKNYSHRIYLGQNIFSDLTYYFHQGSLQTLPWTYPDYQDEAKKDFFSWGRSFLLQSLS